MDDRTPIFGNLCIKNVDICFEKETSVCNAFVEIKEDADLQAIFDSDSHFDDSQELRPSLAFIQNTGAWPKFADAIVTEVLPDDSKISVRTNAMDTLLKLKLMSDEFVVECKEATTTIGATTWA